MDARRHPFLLGRAARGGSDDFAHLPGKKPACGRHRLCYLASDYQLQMTQMYRAVAAIFLIICAPPVFAQQAPIGLTVRDHQFVPPEVPVPAGVKVELVVRNEQAVPAEFESTALHREKVVAPGASVSIFVGPLSPGRYEFFDDFHPATRGVVVVR
jgi:cupredoxin-like protein